MLKTKPPSNFFAKLYVRFITSQSLFICELDNMNIQKIQTRMSPGECNLLFYEDTCQILDKGRKWKISRMRK